MSENSLNPEFYEISAENPCKERYIHDFDWYYSPEEMLVKRITVLIFAVISMILFVGCDSSDSSVVDRIIVYSEPETTTETVGINYIINRNTGKFHYPDCPSVDQMAEHNKKEYTGDRDDLISQGYESCKRCNP